MFDGYNFIGAKAPRNVRTSTGSATGAVRHGRPPVSGWPRCPSSLWTTQAYKDSKLCLMMLSNLLHDKYHKQTGAQTHQWLLPWP